MKAHIKIHGQTVSVEVTVEVYEFLNQTDRKTENLAHEQCRHWGGREFEEYIIAHECAAWTELFGDRKAVRLLQIRRAGFD